MIQSQLLHFENGCIAIFQWVHFKKLSLGRFNQASRAAISEHFHQKKNGTAVAVPMILLHLDDRTIFEKNIDIVLSVDGHALNQCPP